MIGRRALGAMLALPFAARAQAAAAHVVVVGGGFGGATLARAVRAANPQIAVTLVEANAAYVACPRSNEVIAGLRDLEAQGFGYAGLAAAGVTVVHKAATAVDPATRRVTLADGTVLPYDRLVLAPGVDIAWGVLPGYGPEAVEAMPHAWKAGPQTALLRRQLQAMPDGGLVVMAVPTNPYRCPPGPYERASLIAHYLKSEKPRSKLLILDAKDAFSKQKLFEAGWARLYPGLVERVALSDGGKVIAVDAAARTLTTEFETYRADVAIVVPPQRAGAIAAAAGVADRTGWCPVDPGSFESRLQPGIYVIGDAAIAGAMPKSAFAANAQAKVCALALVQSLAGGTVAAPVLMNTCYSLLAPGDAVSVAGVYRPKDGVLTEVEGSGGTTPLDAPPATHALEARYAEGWFASITAETFG